MDAGYSFTISESFTPDTIPLDRLAAYMAGFARLLGDTTSVHLAGIENGSVAIRARVEDHARPKVSDRVRGLRSGAATADVRKAYAELDEMLRRDNATGHSRVMKLEQSFRSPASNAPSRSCSALSDRTANWTDKCTGSRGGTK